MPRRFATAIFVLALGAMFAPVARAQLSASASVTSPGNGAVVAGGITVSAKGQAGGGVDRLELFIDGLKCGEVAPSGVQESASVSCGWDTTRELGGGGYSRNGEYSVTAKVRSNGGATDQASIRVLVDNAPQTPSGVSASASGQNVSVNWNANPEPDIAGYQVHRDGNTVATVQGTSYSESLEPGTYSYSVTALRSSPTGSAKASGTSGASSVTIEAPPPPPGSEPDPTPPEDCFRGCPRGPGSDQIGGGGGGPQNKGGGAFDVGGKRLAPIGLPSSISLPSLPTLAGLPALPEPDPVAWGNFKETLPYELPEGGGRVVPGQFNIAARSPDRIIPPDGLRWVAAGALAMVAAALLWLLGRRLELAAVHGSDSPEQLRLL